MPKKITILALLGALMLLTKGFVLAWVEPTQAPPAGNVSSPVNVSSNSQAKTGNLGVGGANTANNLQITGNSAVSGWLGAGCESSTAGSCESAGGYSLLYPGGYGVFTAGLKIGAYEVISGNKIKADGDVQGARLCIGVDCKDSWATAGSNYWTLNGTNINNNNAGNVGIGTATPLSKVHIQGPSGAGLFDGLTISKASGYGSGSLKINYTNDATGLIHFLIGNDRSFISASTDSYSGTGNPTSLRFFTASSGGSVAEIMRVTSGGDVGIGDITPDGSLKLDVEGQVGASGYCDQNGANCKTISELSSTGAPTTATYLTISSDTTLTNERIITAGAGVAITDGGAGGNLTINVNPALVQTRVSAAGCAVNSSIRVINQDGTVACEADDVGTGGTVGPGTINKIAKFTAASTIGDSIISDVSDEVSILGATASSRFKFSEIGVTRGYFGYGDAGHIFTAASADSLSLRAQGALHLGAGGDVLIATLANGGLGIGNTPTASYQLDVTGNARATGALTASRVNLDGATNYLDTTGGYLTLQSANNEMIFGGGATTYINYRPAPSGTVTSWIWNAGTSATYATHRMGALTVNDNNGVDSEYLITIGDADDLDNLLVYGQIRMAGGTPGAGKVLTSDATGLATWQTPVGGGGTVTSVALSMPNQFLVSNSPITTSGTLTIAWVSQSANTILAAPNGVAGVPTFRSLVSADIPNLDAGKIISGVFPIARGGTGLSATVEDAVMVGSGTTLWQTKALPSCSDTVNSKLLYDSSTNTFSCGVDQVGGVGGTPGGLDGQVQYNNGGAFGGAAAVYYDDVNTRLGVGIAVPTERLDVSGNAKVSANIFAGGGISTYDITVSDNTIEAGQFCLGNGVNCISAWPSGDGGVGGSGAVNYLPKFTAGTTLGNSQIFDNATNVGIGTASPEDKLHVVGNIVQNNTNTLRAKNSVGTVESWMWPRNSDNIMYTNFGSAGWNIRNNSSTNVMFLQNGGNVGIGTTAPSAKLDVAGTAEINGALDMTKNQVKNMALDNLTVNPASPATGQIWICIDSGNDCTP